MVREFCNIFCVKKVDLSLSAWGFTLHLGQITEHDCDWETGWGRKFVSCMSLMHVIDGGIVGHDDDDDDDDDHGNEC